MNIAQFIGFAALLVAPACATAVGPATGGESGQSAAVTAQASGQPGASGSAQVAVGNPATGYCVALGYVAGVDECAFPDGSTCEQWAFFRGECGQAHSYCNLHGGSVANKQENVGTSTVSYALCTLPNGSHCIDDQFARTARCE